MSGHILVMFTKLRAPQLWMMHSAQCWNQYYGKISIYSEYFTLHSTNLAGPPTVRFVAGRLYVHGKNWRMCFSTYWAKKTIWPKT